MAYGPTWRRDDDGKFVLPEKTLGWQAVDWCSANLQQPDGPSAGEPWIFTREQTRFILWWYAVDARGRFLYRSGMFRRMKGHGKDPLAAVMCAVEFVGPCRFGGWAKDGEPIAVTNAAAWIQIAAVSKDQTRNTMTLFPAIFSRQCIEEHQIDLGKEIIYAYRGARRIEAITSSPRAVEGGRPTFSVKNESHHWLDSNEGSAMSAVMNRNASKVRDGSSRVLAISNAHAPGEGSDAERDYEAWMQILASGEAESSDFLYDSIEALEDVDPKGDPELLKAAIDVCRGDSTWIDLDRLVAECHDPRTSEALSRRFYLNQLHAHDDRAFDYRRWLELADKEHKVPDGALVVGGFDGSVSGDWTALVATEVATGYQWPVGIWKPAPMQMDDGALLMRIDVAAVEAAVEGFFAQFNVWRLNMDPYYWTEQMNAWAGRYNTANAKPIVEWRTTNLRKMAFALLTYSQAIASGQVSHPDNPDLNAGILNAYKQAQQFADDSGEPMWTIRKERPLSPLKIDPAIAGALSWEARAAAIAEGLLNQNDWHGIYLGEAEEQ